MRPTHVAGEKAFVDYSGKLIGIVDPAIGEIREAEISGGVPELLVPDNPKSWVNNASLHSNAQKIRRRRARTGLIQISSTGTAKYYGQ